MFIFDNIVDVKGIFTIDLLVKKTPYVHPVKVLFARKDEKFFKEIEELRAFLYEQPFQIPSRTTFLGMAIMTVFSICKGLDNEFDIVSTTTGRIRRVTPQTAIYTGVSKCKK